VRSLAETFICGFAHNELCRYTSRRCPGIDDPANARRCFERPARWAVVLDAAYDERLLPRAIRESVRASRRRRRVPVLQDTVPGQPGGHDPRRCRTTSSWPSQRQAGEEGSIMIG